MRIPAYVKALILPLMVAGLIPAVIVLLTAGGRLGWSLLAPFDYGIIAVGFIAVAFGLALLAITVTLFSGIGNGTLAPWAPPRKLVLRGPYRYVRNPMILGVLLVIAGEAMIFGSLWMTGYLVFGFTLNHLYFVYSEEPGLAKRFGQEYLCYKKNVPRWIPRLRPWNMDNTRS